MKIPKKKLDAVSRELKILMRIVEPMLNCTPEQVATWIFTLIQMLEKDFDYGTDYTKRIYPEFENCDFGNLLSQLDEFHAVLSQIKAKDFGNRYQQSYEVIQKSFSAKQEKTEQSYPEYVEIAAKWWQSKNQNKFNKDQKNQFLERLKRRIDQQIRVQESTLICTKDCPAKCLTLNLGGYEKKVKYSEYMAMIVTPKEVSVQIGKATRWRSIWKGES